MPAVRDISWNLNATQTATTIVIPVPSFQQNDLLLAIITADTGAGVWSSPGWNSLFAQTNTCQQAMLWKIAGPTETDPTFTSTVAETYNGCIISIRDVNVATPFGATPVRSTVNQAAAAKFTLPSITTNTANSLIIYAVSNSSAGVPSLIEGPVTGILAADGSAESQGVGWGFKAATGATPTNVTCSNIATGAGVNTTLQIVPPATGATVIPTYNSEDLSSYINPIHGTTAYNGDTALAATADTNFGTSFSTAVGTITGVDATAASATDTGINSFHSTGQLTSAATVNMAGAEIVFATANRPNVTGKNILVHAQVATPTSLQRLGSVNSRRGVWFGIRSATGVYEIFQVLGADSPGSAGRPIPLIINDTATTTVATAGTLNPASILAMGLWCSGATAGTSVLQFAQIWLMDKTTICGGNAAEPITIPGINEVAARGHERVSVVQQGAAQMLCLQHLQFGDGTNPTYLKLDATAIEFPSQANIATKQITYHSVDNKIGLSYFAGATDQIHHTNSVISSPSKFFWRIEAASSPSATYNFAGLSIIGAGDVQFRNVTTFNDMSFTNCSSMAQNSALITNGAFKNSYLFSNNPANIQNNSFTSGGTGHAIEITVPGTYSFIGNQFFGYGLGATLDAAIYNNSGGAVTLNVSGGGTVPTVRNGVGATTTVNAAANVTLTGLKADSEVRAYVGTNPATATEVAGTESSGVTFSFAQSVAGQAGYIQIFHVEYQPVFLNVTYSGSDAEIPIQQITDRQYSRGTVFAPG